MVAFRRWWFSPFSFAVPALAVVLLSWTQAGQGAAAVLSLDKAVAEVRKLSGGRVLAAEEVEADQPPSPFYRIKVLLPDGTVRIYKLDPGTGKLLD